MEIIIGLAAIIVTLAIFLITNYQKIEQARPELTIELIYTGGSSGQRGQSPKNDYSKGSINIDEVIFYWEVIWSINIKITNNSENTAYYPKIKVKPENFPFSRLERLDKNTPIEKNKKILLKGEYKIIEECKGRDRTHHNGLPGIFDNLIIILEYQNKFKKVYHTIFSMSSNRNKFYKKLPKNIRS